MLQPNQPMGMPNMAATGPQAAKPQQGGQQMPAGQMLSAVAPGGIASALDTIGNAYRGNPKALEQKGVSGDLLAALAAQRLKAKMELAQRELQMEAAGQQGGQPQKTVVQQNEDALLELTKQEMQDEQMDTLKQKQGQMQEGQKRLMQQAMNPQQQGIGGIPAPNAAEPKAMAAGGIVAFAGDTDGSYVTIGEDQYEVDPRTGKVKVQGVWTDPEFVRQSKRSEWNTARRKPGEGQEYKESTQQFLQGLDQDYAAAKKAQEDAYDTAMAGKQGFVWKGQFYPVNEQGKVVVNGAPTDPRVLQGATPYTYPTKQPAGATPEPTQPTAPAAATQPAQPGAAQPGAQPAPNAANIAPPARPAGLPALPGGGGNPATRLATQASEVDPAKAAAAERESSYQFMKPSDEDVAARREQLAGIKALNQKYFDPDQQQIRELTRTLAVGPTSFAASTMGNLGRNAVASGEAEYRQQRAALLGEEKGLGSLMADIYAPKKEAVEVGRSAYTTEGGIKQQGISSLANIANEELRSAVQMASVAAHNETNRLRQQEMTEAKAQTEYRNIQKEINDRTKDIETKFGKDIGLLVIREQAGTLDDAGKQTLAKKRADMDIAVQVLKDAWQPALDVAARKAGIPVPESNKPAATGDKVDTALVNKLTNTR